MSHPTFLYSLNKHIQNENNFAVEDRCKNLSSVNKFDFGDWVESTDILLNIDPSMLTKVGRISIEFLRGFGEFLLHFGEILIKVLGIIGKIALGLLLSR